MCLSVIKSVEVLHIEMCLLYIYIEKYVSSCSLVASSHHSPPIEFIPFVRILVSSDQTIIL